MTAISLQAATAQRLNTRQIKSNILNRTIRLKFSPQDLDENSRGFSKECFDLSKVLFLGNKSLYSLYSKEFNEIDEDGDDFEDRKAALKEKIYQDMLTHLPSGLNEDSFTSIPNVLALFSRKAISSFQNVFNQFTLDHYQGVFLTSRKSAFPKYEMTKLTFSEKTPQIIAIYENMLDEFLPTESHTPAPLKNPLILTSQTIYTFDQDKVTAITAFALKAI